MVFGTKYRQLIHYSLIACTLLIQVAIVVYFYNEYFNQKKLLAIERQIHATRGLRVLTDNSRKYLLNAQESLQQFIHGSDKKHLEAYFRSLRKLSANLDSIHAYENINPSLKNRIASRRGDISQLSNLQTLIDSVYKKSIIPLQKNLPPKMADFDIRSNPRKYEIEVHHSSDSIVKKGLLPRLKDAIKGNTEVKRDTTYITTKYESSVDTLKIKSDFDSTLKAIDSHYQREIKKYQENISTTNAKSNNLYHIYDHLMVFSNNLMEIYDGAVSDFSRGLEKQYFEQNSRNNTIRKYALMGLMILMFFVLMLIMYYTRLAFRYEKELKAANEKINKNLNFKSRILGMLSHEIRSPLKIINIFIGRIAKRTDDEKIQDYLRSIKFTNDSLLIQANQILDYTKNQERKIELKPVKINLRHEIEAILKIFRPYIESRNNVFETRNEIRNDSLACVDITKIQQVITNLLGNANKFTENGRISVIAHIVPIDPTSGKLSISITDTGVGISEADLRKIFEPYYQGIISDDIDEPGAGLGLNLCKEIIDLFGGNISATSDQDKGTTIAFEINVELVS